MAETDYKEFLKHAKGNTARLQKQTKKVGMDYFKMHTDAMEPGAISKKNKELISLAIAISKQCDGCITSHLASAKEDGATIDEIVEVVNVAIMMNGGPAVVYGGKALEAAEQFYGVDLK
ncbi:carboxymuconolactone decarboxylase family protein [Companilactobacillus furfuricola]|uniref:carboxymuconolactone decarboxylase family protein n=1 Tax=Companilactobacillus furfuricola TaxID=1462575 RepID=UPI000F76C378|nr:carboxymuconolactone decarboxylase family protein [Companilactobacillus furfuricola]